MFKNIRKGFLAVSLVMVIATSIMPGRVCTITRFCPVQEAKAQGQDGIMGMIMMMMMMMMMSQMLQGKQGERGGSAAKNLLDAGKNNNQQPNQPKDTTDPKDILQLPEQDVPKPDPAIGSIVNKPQTQQPAAPVLPNLPAGPNPAQEFFVPIS